MTIKFTHEAVLKGYSFLAGEVHSFPDTVAEQMISDGVAFRVPSSEDKVNQRAIEALQDARNRDTGRG